MADPDFNLEKDLVLDHFQSSKSQLKKKVFVFQVWKNVKKKYTTEDCKSLPF